MRMTSGGRESDDAAAAAMGGRKGVFTAELILLVLVFLLAGGALGIAICASLSPFFLPFLLNFLTLPASFNFLSPFYFS